MGIGITELIVVLALFLGAVFFWGTIFAVVFFALRAVNKNK